MLAPTGNQALTLAGAAAPTGQAPLSPPLLPAQAPCRTPAALTAPPAPALSGVEAATEALRAGCALTFLPATDYGPAGLLIYRADGQPMPDVPLPSPLAAAPYDLILATTTGPARTRVFGWVLPAGITAPALLQIENHAHAHPSATAWARATRIALHMIAARLVYPALTDQGRDQWRIGPWPAAANRAVQALADAMSIHAHCTVIDGTTAPGSEHVPDPRAAIEELTHALADATLRTPAATALFPQAPFADPSPHTLPPDLAAWTDHIEERLDGGPLPGLVLDIDEPDSAGQLQARLQLASHPAADISGVHPPVAAADVWNGSVSLPGFDRTLGRSRVRRALRRAARHYPALAPLADQRTPQQMTLDGPALLQVLKAAPALAHQGLSVRPPQQLTTALTAQAIVGAPIPARPTGAPPRFALTELVAFRWQFALAGQELTEAEMNALAESARPLVRIRGQWVLLDDALAARARDRNLPLLPAHQALNAALTGTITLDGDTVPCRPDGALADITTRLTTDEHTTDTLPAPADLNATLRHYQLRALAWLANTTELGFGAVLADDMGLGKTLTALAYTLHRRQHQDQGPVLVLCPASLVTNWSREAARFAPTLPVIAYHGAGRTLDELPDNALVITTYGVLRRDHEQLAARTWSLVIADEAQMAKNPRSSTARHLRTLPARTRIALTGTPIENNLSELWAILDWTNPGLFATLAAFRARYANAAERDTTGPEAQALARLIAPFVLRRLKTDPRIAPELPEKVHVQRIVQLTREQAGLYEAMVRETMDAVAQSTGITRHGLVLKLLTGLKQIANHPAHYLREKQPTPGDRTFASRSAKLAALDDIVDAVTDSGEALLVFTSYVAMGRLLTAHLASRGHQPAFLHGGLDAARRQSIVDDFQDGHTPVLILSLKAAGTGLNLTRASHVVHYDRSWNPAVEDQATDRAHRLGSSHRTITVHHLINEGTVEDRIAALLEHKRTLQDAVLTSGDRALAKLTDTELADLVTLGAAA
ncbi:DEAD/DEAH box helicase [Streptomyces sp. NPDC020800]|uniref:DEAD/DEAH box helicase n=1 Tax=Streptomyces sp. NPDC020800 TaxID=3365092 RepID=UPI0037A4BE6E